jgi:hypothetical protein
MKPSLGITMIALTLAGAFYIYSTVSNSKLDITSQNETANINTSLETAFPRTSNPAEENPENIGTGPEMESIDSLTENELEEEFTNVQSALDLLENPLQ